MADLHFTVEAPGPTRDVAFPGTTFLIGGGPGCALRFEDAGLAPQHAEVVRDTRDQWWIRDLTGAGVFINGEPVIDERLSAGDTLRLGQVVLAVKAVQEDTFAEGAELAPSTVLEGRYRVVRKLANGKLGELYRAEHVELIKALAIKVLRPERSNDAAFVSRLKREAVAVSTLGHPHIVALNDVGRLPDGRFFLVMEFLDGKPLSRLLGEGAFSAERVSRLVSQMARALASAHAIGIAHGDLRLEHVMLVPRPGQSDFVKLLDFGISTAPATPRGDLYALGVVILELLRGEAIRVNGALPLELPPITAPEGVPPTLEALLRELLSTDPAVVPPSMDAVATALEALAPRLTPVNRTGAHQSVARTEAPTSRLPPVDLPRPRTSSGEAAVEVPTELVTRGRTSRETPRVTREVPARPRTASRATMILAVLVIGLSLALLLTRAGGEAPVQPQPEVPVVSPTAVEPVRPQPAPEPAPVHLVVETIPEHADVLEDDALLGTTPMTLNRAPGTTVTLRLEARGYEPLERKVRFEADSSVRFELSRKAVAPAPTPVEPPPDDLKDTPY